MTTEELAKEIQNKTPAERLRLAADLLELKEERAFKIARSIVRLVDAEMLAVAIKLELEQRGESK